MFAKQLSVFIENRQGRLGELKQTKVTPRKDPAGPQPMYEYKYAVDNDVSEWHYTDTQ